MSDCLCCDASQQLCEGLIERGLARCCTDCQHEVVVPTDWPTRFRAAADAAERVQGRRAAAWYGLRDLASWCETQPSHVVEAIGRALLGEES